jgi:cytochrome c-type biogenesis protein CcmH
MKSALRIRSACRGAHRALLGVLTALCIVVPEPARFANAASETPPVRATLPALDPEIESLAHTERFRHLAAELRCLVCQNQTVLDSQADLALDLRQEVLRQMAQGRSDPEIKAHLVARYGEFVLYRPPFSARNLALWLAPGVMLLLGFWILRRLTRRPSANEALPPQPDAVQQLNRLLSDNPAAPPQATERSANHSTNL